MLEKGLDVRTKLTIVLCLSSAGVFLQHVYILSALIILTIILAFSFKADLIKALRSTKRLWYILIAIVILQSIFTRSDDVILAIKGFEILTLTGVIKGLEFFLRVSIVIFSATIVATSNYREIVQGLVQLKVPYDIAFMVSIAIRFLPLLRDEISQTLTAIQLRGLDLKKIRFGQRIKIYYYIFTPVVAGVLKKAHELSMAMETRAYRAYGERTSYLILSLKPADYAVITLSLLITVSLFIMFYVFKIPGGLI